MPSDAPCNCCDYYFEYQFLAPPVYNVRKYDGTGAATWSLAALGQATSAKDIACFGSSPTYFYVVGNNATSASSSLVCLEQYEDGATPTLQWSVTRASYTSQVVAALSSISPRTQSQYAIPFTYPTCICTDSSGNLYVGGYNDTISKWDSSGTLLWAVNLQPFYNPGPVTLQSSSGPYTYFPVAYNPTIQCIATDGTYVFVGIDTYRADTAQAEYWQYPVTRMLASDGTFDRTFTGAGTPGFSSRDSLALNAGVPSVISLSCVDADSVYIGQTSNLGTYSYFVASGVGLNQTASHGTYNTLHKAVVAGAFWNDPSSPLTWSTEPNNEAGDVMGIGVYANGSAVFTTHKASFNSTNTRTRYLQVRNSSGSLVTAITDAEAPAALAVGQHCMLDPATDDIYVIKNTPSPFKGKHQRYDGNDLSLTQHYSKFWSDAVGNVSRRIYKINVHSSDGSYYVCGDLVGT